MNYDNSNPNDVLEGVNAQLTDANAIPVDPESGLEAEQVGQYGEDDVPGSELTDVDVEDLPDEEVEETETVATDGEPKAKKEPKAKPAPKRGELPEGYVTPIGLAKVLTERELYTNREGEVAELKPQMVYSYIKNAPVEFPFPLETVQDSIGAERSVVQLEAGVDWWIAKNERAAARKANAEAKATKAAEAAKNKAAKPADEGTVDEDNSSAEEAE